MTTPADATDAVKHAQRQRFGFLPLLKVDESKAAAGDLDLARKVTAAATPDAYDKLLADKKVNALFCRGVLHFQPEKEKT